MNYLQPDLLDGLSRRYVTGTMGRLARRRFARLLRAESTAEDAVLAWEERLAPLAWSVAPVQPSELVWQRISRKLGLGHTVVSRQDSKPSTSERRSGFGLAAALALCAVGLGITSIGWWQSASRPPETVVETVVETVEETVVEPAIVAVLGGDANEPLWVARIYQSLSRLDVQVQTLPEAQPRNDYQLWVLDTEGTPFSLGLLPQTGSISMDLDPALVATVTQSNTLAVSLEPLGGSPQAVPTGEVLFTAALLTP